MLNLCYTYQEKTMAQGKEPVIQYLECVRVSNNAYFYDSRKRMRVSVIDDEGYLPNGYYVCETSPIHLVSISPYLGEDLAEKFKYHTMLSSKK
jgi:hypothetical protein